MQDNNLDLPADNTDYVEPISLVEIQKWLEDNRPRLTQLRQELEKLQCSI